MDNDQLVREQLVFLLTDGHAHMLYAEAVADFPPEHINTIPTNLDYSFWDILEHIRITQKDIVDFTEYKQYKELAWPKDYWPEKGKQATIADWKKTITDYKADLKRMIAIINNRSNDLHKKFPWGDGQNIMKEAQVIADHTSYHLGEFAILRQVMQTWPETHK